MNLNPFKRRRPAPAVSASSTPPHGTTANVPAKALGHQAADNGDGTADGEGWDLADQRLWIFEWPPGVLARSEPATVTSFADWLREHGESDLTRRKLCSLYFEFVDVGELCPVPWREFDRSLKDAGIVRYRSSNAGRPWLYRVAPSATVHRIDGSR